MNKAEQDRNYASVNKNMKARLEKCARWCEFDEYTFSLEHWSNYDYATAWVKTYDEMYNILWEACLTIYDGDKKPHEMRIVFDKTLSKTCLNRKPAYFSTVDRLLDKMEEKRQEFVKRQFKKAVAAEREMTLDAIDSLPG